MRVVIWGGVSVRQGPGVAPSSMHSAASPAMCGAAMLVPDIVYHGPVLYVDRMQTPGAAIVCSMPAVVSAKFENDAGLSSGWPHAGGPTLVRSWPLVSLMAVVVMTSL